jgi:hypothetical protein
MVIDAIDRVVIARGIAMPFLPIRPVSSSELRNQGNVEEFYWKQLRKEDWVIQPKLEGDRACVGVLDKNVYIQNRHGQWYTKRVNNLEDFRRLPSGTVLDGEVFKGNFYPFDCLALAGKSYLLNTVGEREVLAFQVSKILKHEWKFERPSKNPGWPRCVATCRCGAALCSSAMGSPYIIAGDPTKQNLHWMKRTWG